MPVAPSIGLLTALVEHKGYRGFSKRVEGLTLDRFKNLLDRFTTEFTYSLRAIDLTHNDNLEALLDQILEAFTLKIGQILQADRTTIFLLDPEREELWSKIAQGEGQKSLEIRLPMHTGIAGYVATTGECLNIPDVSLCDLFNPDIDRKTNYQTHTILCMPIHSSEGEVVAVVELLNKNGEQPFSHEDEERFREFSNSIGIILESCQRFYVAARNQRGVAALLKATTFLSQSLDLDRTLKAVMDEARELMQADRSTLFLLDREHNELWSKVAQGKNGALLEIRIPANKGIAGFVASTGRTLNIPDAYADPRFDPSTDRKSGYRTRNMLCMPVFNSMGDLIGVTQLINKHQGSFTSSDEEFMRAFNIQAGVALENAQLFESVLDQNQRITEQNRRITEQNLQISREKRYQEDVLRSLSNAVISTDLEGRIVTINEAAYKLLNLTEAQSIEGCFVWDIVPLDELEHNLHESLRNQSKLDFPGQDLRLMGPDGKQGELSVNLSVNPLSDPEGGVCGGLVVMENISQEKRMKSMLYRYVTKDVAERVLATADDSLMEGERRDVTILFSDIRGYTALTEDLGASEVVSLLNSYFDKMVEAVLKYEGTLDKFIGDALMAVFGAPMTLADHAHRATQSALEMRELLKEFNRARIADNLTPVRVGIGISSGEVVSGNIGSRKRMDYTVIGDGVNVSSRLEDATKQYKCDIILSQHTYALCKDHIRARELDTIRVRNRNEPITLYELIGSHGEQLDSELSRFLEVYERGRQAYDCREFRIAINHFRDAFTMRPNDRATLLHIERCQSLIRNPPGPAWDGVWNIVEK
ncbi:GAF domain-containing protein [Leptolyngbya sp. FACHB-261]|nr:GAF domain-containing protein [Leptolyngbya sp. FACHB-261]